MSGPVRREVPAYRLELGGGYSHVALGNGGPEFSGGHFQARLGQDFIVHPQHSFFLGGVFRNAYLTSRDAAEDLSMAHFGLEGGYEAYLVPDMLSLFTFAGIGTNIFYSLNIRDGDDSRTVPLENNAALALTLGGGISVGRGIFVVSGGFEPSFGLTARPDIEFPWIEGYNPIGYYFNFALDLARIAAVGGANFPDPDAERFVSGLEFGGMLDASYTHNFGSPESGENSLRIFDTRSDRPMFNLAQLHLVRETDAEVPFGFGLVFDAGENPNVSAAADSFSGDHFDFQQLWGEIRLPIGNGLRLRGGKIATHIGYEVIEPTNNQISRSWGFGLAIPFTHGGLLGKYALTDSLEMSLGVANGWDNLYGRETGPTALYGLSHEAADWFSWSVAGALGGDQGRLLSVIDGIATFTAGDFTLTANLDWGTQGEGGPEEPQTHWVAASLSPRYNFHHHFGLSGRGEVFHDPQGARTGTAQTLGHVALTTHIRPVPEEYFSYFPMELRAELRHDLANADSFEQGSGFASDQTTFAVSATLNFENFLNISRSTP